MKFSIDKKALIQHLDYISRFTAKRNTLPILANVYISAKESSITLCASNLSVSSMVDSIKADVIEPGDTTVNAEKLHNLVKLLPDTMIDFATTSNDRLSIKVGDTISYQLATLPADEFPSISTHDTKFAEIPGTLFVDMLKDTITIQSKDNLKEFLRCAYIVINKDSLEVVATDGRRITKRVEPIPATNPIEPFKLIEEASKLVIQTFANTEVIKVSINKNSIIMTGIPSGINEITLSARMMENQYPDYNSIINAMSDYNIGFVANTKALIASIRRVALLSPSTVQRIALSVANDTLRLSSENPDLGRASEIIDCTSDGEIEVYVDARYLLDALSTIKADTTAISFKGSENVIKIVPNSTPTHIWGVMPMRK